MRVNFMYENHECYILLDETFIGHIEFEWKGSKELRHVTFYESTKLGLKGCKKTYHEAIQGTNFKNLMEDIKERAKQVVKAQVISTFKEDFKKLSMERIKMSDEEKELFKKARYREWTKEERTRYRELGDLQWDCYKKEQELERKERIAIQEACKDVVYEWNWIWY